MKTFYYWRNKPKFLLMVGGLVLLSLVFAYLVAIQYELRLARQSLSTATRVEVNGNFLHKTNEVIPLTKTVTNPVHVSALANILFDSLESGVSGPSRYRGEGYATMLVLQFKFYSANRKITHVNVLGTSTVLVSEKIIWTARDDYRLYHKLRQILEHETESGDR